jgi:hypothetical protein
MPLNHGAGHMPVLGFGNVIHDAAATVSPATEALETGFRLFPKRILMECCLLASCGWCPPAGEVPEFSGSESVDLHS